MVDVKGQFRNPVLTDKEDTWLLPLELYLTTDDLIKVLGKSKDGKLNIFIKPQ